MRAKLTVWCCFGLALLLAAGCGEQAQPDQRLDLRQVLGDAGEDGFRRADRVVPIRFPADHGAHPDFRTEWWYLTGNLRDPGGRSFGYQLTFFRSGLAPPDSQPPKSAWSGNGLWMAHLALADLQTGTRRALERFSRENPGLAGARAEPLRIWLEDWSIEAAGQGVWRVVARDAEVRLALELVAAKPPVLHGEAGLSRKSATSGSASYYYSITRLHTHGTIGLAGDSRQVEGLSWFDREWSTSLLDTRQTGWDWFSLQFDDGRDLMYFQLRGDATAAHSEGSLVAADGAKTSIATGRMLLRERRWWQGPDGACYAVEWELTDRQRGEHWLVEAALDDQFMALSIPYWEGAVIVRQPATGARLGSGFLEMTRIGASGEHTCPASQPAS